MTVTDLRPFDTQGFALTVDTLSTGALMVEALVEGALCRHYLQASYGNSL